MENKIIITKNAIVKVKKIEKDTLLGFDILKEELVELPNQPYIEITEQIISLLGNEENRLKIAHVLCFKDKDVAKLLGITERTLRRMDIEYLGEKKNTNYSKLNLSKKTVLEIRKMCEEKELNYTQIGHKFRISNTTIGRIANKKGAYENV